jgi:hypothetical protein
MTRGRTVLTVTTALVLAGLGGSAAADAVPQTSSLQSTAPTSATIRLAAAAGAQAGIGDPYFPRAGNPGYQVRHYTVRAAWHPETHVLSGHTGSRSPQSNFLNTYHAFEASSAYWKLPIGNPGPQRMFDYAVYDRGAMTLQALRNRVGGRDFFTIARRWVHGNRDGVGGTGEFKQLAERVSGEQLDGLFRAWLYSGHKPAPTAANGL